MSTSPVRVETKTYYKHETGEVVATVTAWSLGPVHRVRMETRTSVVWKWVLARGISW